MDVLSEYPCCADHGRGPGHAHALEAAEGPAPAVRPADVAVDRSTPRREAGAERIVVVLGAEADEVRRVLPPDVEVAIQDPPAGTGDAVAQARDALGGLRARDRPLGRPPAARRLHSSRRSPSATPSSGAAATVTTRELEDPGQYGRIVRGADGEIERIVETKNPGDATPEELAIKEINAGTYAFAVGPLFDALAGVRADNSQGEYYLGDVLPLLRAAGHTRRRRT